MQPGSLEKLDNPVWHALNETHQRFSLAYDNLKCYQPDHCPFGAFTGSDNVADHIDQYAALVNDFFIVGEKPRFSDKISLVKELVCLQMITDKAIIVEEKDAIVPLNDHHAEEVCELVTQVLPGYYKINTIRLGSYYGIYKNDMLVSVAGERMKMEGLTEVSAIVTHPGHTGKGYSKQLIAFLVKKIISEGNVPFLHVAETNAVAINLYRRLGFDVRRKMSFWNFKNEAVKRNDH